MWRGHEEAKVVLKVQVKMYVKEGGKVKQHVKVKVTLMVMAKMIVKAKVTVKVKTKMMVNVIAKDQDRSKVKGEGER